MSFIVSWGSVLICSRWPLCSCALTKTLNSLKFFQTRSLCYYRIVGHVSVSLFRFFLRQKCVKSFHNSKVSSLLLGFRSKPSLDPNEQGHADFSSGCRHYHCKASCFGKPTRFSGSSSMKIRCAEEPSNVMNGIKIGTAVNFSSLMRAKRSLSSLNSQRVDGGSAVIKAGKTLPWLASKGEEAKRSKKNPRRVGSAWEEFAKRMDRASGDSIWAEPAENCEKSRISKTIDYSQDGQGKRNGFVGNDKSRNKKSWHSSNVVENEIDYEEEEQVEGEEMEVVDDPRWDEIRNRFNRFVDVRDHGREKPEYKKWNKQGAWGRKTWKEATESTIPKMVGEGVYGVGPVLAALSAGRREFYSLYIQEGLDLSGNNRKKKDKKGFEKILRLAENIELTIQETSKHDLNMIVDNRPHQGFVLDASPLEMVKVKELDPITSDEEKLSLWIALDEVTDPQNLGAIIRSAYFFGASGVVLCAKNSAPLSGVVSKASAGSLELMELRYCKNMMQFLVASAGNGWRILGGSVSSKAIPLNEVLPGTPTVLVLGSEGTGLRPLVERSCTELVKINGNVDADVASGDSDDVKNEEFRSFLAVESLNVSVAAGVLLHHLIGNKHN